jgi:hypothetical protein
MFLMNLLGPGASNWQTLLNSVNLRNLVKLSILAILAGVLALSITAAPAFANSAHTITVATDQSSYSCSSPIGISGAATGNNPIRRDVKITVRNDETGQIVAFTKATVKHGAFSTTISFTNESMPEGYFTVTATYYGQVAVTDSPFYWAC